MDLAAQVNKDEWAANEVDIAASINSEPYYVECLKSAERAFNCLLNDPHTGMSIGVTKSILNRLIDGKPLTPIDDTPDMWCDISSIFGHGHRVYQCKRMSSLFKYVYEDGQVEIHDNGMFLCTEVSKPDVPFSFGIVSDILREKYPITMPYMPCSRPYHVIVNTNLYDDSRSDFDTFSIIKVIRPDGAVDSINRYFKHNEDTWVEIEEDEYLTHF